MKILCETQLFNRLKQMKKIYGMVKATLAAGYNTRTTAKDSNGDSNKELEIIIFTQQDKRGKRFKVKNNIVKIFTKFLKDGKATISFKQPAENLMIKCDPIQLKGFLLTIRSGLEGKDVINLRMNIAAATAIPQKPQPPTKMIITSRADYPAQRFPRTLKSLSIMGIDLHRVTFEMCKLKNLTTLNLSCNTIEQIPKELGRLALVELNLKRNFLGIKNSFEWLMGKRLQQSLKELDLSANQLDIFPPELIKYENLVSLNLNNNNLQQIPFAVRRMRSLRYLHMSTNKLESLPAALTSSRLEILDVWGNNFQPQQFFDIDQKTPRLGAEPKLYTPSPLWKLAACSVNQNRLPHTTATLPWMLVDILSEAPQCACGKLCNHDDILVRAAMSTFENVSNLVYRSGRLIYADIVLCGRHCSGRKHIPAP